MIKLGRSFWWITLLAAVSLIVSRLPGMAENPVYTRLTIALVFLQIAGGLWSLVSIIGLKVKRSTRTTRKQVGEIFTENFEIRNESLIPKVWLKVSDQAVFSKAAGSRLITYLGSHQSRTYVAYTLLQERGWFELGPTQIETGDFFGMFLIQKTFLPKMRLLVIPYTVHINQFPAPFGILPGGRALRQKTLEVTPYAAGVREYEPGDPLKRIHWPTSARKQKLIVKEFEKDPLAEVWIFLDMQKAVHVRQNEEDEPVKLDELWWMKEKREFQLPPDTEEYAISIAASISRYYIRQKREVGLVAVGQNYTILPAERGERQLGKVLETLAVLKAEGDLPLWGLVTSQLKHLTRGSTIILISPSTDERLLGVTMELIQRGLMPVVILIDPSSFGGERYSREIKAKLINRGVLTFLVEEGNRLKNVLETPQSALNERFIFRKGY